MLASRGAAALEEYEDMIPNARNIVYQGRGGWGGVGHKDGEDGTSTLWARGAPVRSQF